MPNKLWTEEDNLSPDNDFGVLISGAETMVRNYAAKLLSPVCILRIPRIVDKIYVEQNFVKLIKILKRDEKIDFDISSNLTIQFINMDNLVESLYQLIKMRWDGIEVFHIDSFQQNFIPLLDSLKTILNSKTSLLKDNKLISLVKELLTVSPLVRKRIDAMQKVHSIHFLKEAVLDSKKTQRILNLPKLELKDLINNISFK